MLLLSNKRSVLNTDPEKSAKVFTFGQNGCLRWAGICKAYVEKILEHVEHQALSPEIVRKDRPAISLEAIALRHPTRDSAIQEAYSAGAYTITEIAAWALRALGSCNVIRPTSPARLGPSPAHFESSLKALFTM